MISTPFSLPPPAGYSKKDLATFELPANTPMYRCYNSKRLFTEGVHYGKTGRHRFDDPRKGIGVMYVETSLEAALVETLFHSRPEINAISISELKMKACLKIEYKEALTLVNLMAKI